ncbi:hypothetical protein BG015_004116 [Linnemannia schmuckeri]|uniref:Uncharacterized protein n=1 Tax=Linnemannia schmuckeri TaxID=64567 RepID=A0A9P5RFB2_9FUNG|nr:hypothetical protein BG015_004116 [Linnemannia schmuckeri]
MSVPPWQQTGTKHLYSRPIQSSEHTSTTMSPFKSNKNKTSSAASTPAQTPRPSVDTQRPAQASKMTRDQALELALRKSVQTMPANFGLM